MKASWMYGACTFAVNSENFSRQATEEIKLRLFIVSYVFVSTEPMLFFFDVSQYDDSKLPT